MLRWSILMVGGNDFEGLRLNPGNKNKDKVDVYLKIYEWICLWQRFAMCVRTYKL